MAAVRFRFDDVSSESILGTLKEAHRDKSNRLERMARAVRSHTYPCNKDETHLTATSNVDDDTHRITLGQAAVDAIQRLILVKRIMRVEHETMTGKERLSDELVKWNQQGGTPSKHPGGWRGIVDRLPRPSGRFAVPRTNLTPVERQQRVRAIATATLDIVNKYSPDVIPDSERQALMRRYTGLLGESVDAAIAHMDSPLPSAEELSVPLLCEYGIGIKELIFRCDIPISELYDAQIVTSLDDLATLDFAPAFLGGESTGFSVDDFVSIFGGSYAVLKTRFGMKLSELPQRAFSARQLKLLEFDFAVEHGTLDDIRRMGLTVEQLTGFGLTVDILTNQFHMDNIIDLSRKLGWKKSDIKLFVSMTTPSRSQVVMQ